jgi:predicted peptidase
MFPFKKTLWSIAVIIIITTTQLSAQKENSGKVEKKIIPFGTAIDPNEQVKESQKLAKSLSAPESKQWKAKGDQKRMYHFAEANADMPYRIYVPETWDGKSKIPLVMFLHGAWNDESSYLDADNKLMLRLAEEHGFLLVSPLGYNKLGAYGTCLRLPGGFGKPEEAAKMMAKQTDENWKTLSLSEKDVINVLELVLNEYPVDSESMFLTGHSMGSGGAWYLGAKYTNYWKAIAPMSGPFVEENMYPWNRIRKKPVFISEGSKSLPSLESSRQMADWMKKNDFTVQYKEVDADHGGMVPLILPDVFSFFNQCRK